MLLLAGIMVAYADNVFDDSQMREDGRKVLNSHYQAPQIGYSVFFYCNRGGYVVSKVRLTATRKSDNTRLTRQTRYKNLTAGYGHPFKVDLPKRAKSPVSFRAVMKAHRGAIISGLSGFSVAEHSA